VIPRRPARIRDGAEETTHAGAAFRVPLVARAVVRLMRLVPAIVTTAFAGWAVAAAVAGNGTVAVAAALMSALALSVAVRSALSSPDR
jgi:hypothetical protein